MTIPFPFGRRLVLSAQVVPAPAEPAAPEIAPEWDDRALVRLATRNDAWRPAPSLEQSLILLGGRLWDY